MYKVLIVDDEEWIRERLKLTIDWHDLGINVVEEAEDGEEALKISEEVSPEIIITDIRMPLIDGLEFIKRLREKGCCSKVIIISGYSDFQYAQKAIKLGAFDYILKPIEDEDLISVVKRCIKELDIEREKDAFDFERDLKLSESIPVMRDKLFINLIEGSYKNEDEIIQKLEYLDIKNTCSNYLCFIVQPEGLEDVVGDENGWDRKLMEFAVHNITNDFSIRIGKLLCLSGYNGEVVTVISSDNKEEILRRQVISISKGIRKMTKKFLKLSVTVGVGSYQTSILNIPQSYNDAKQILHYKAHLGINKIYEFKSIDMSDVRPDYGALKNLDIFLNNIKIGDKNSALKNLDTIINNIYENNTIVYPINLKLLYIDIINSIFKSILEVKNINLDFSEYSLKFLEQLHKLQTIDEISKWLRDTVDSIINLFILQKDSKKRKIVECALEYIKSHYNEPVTLNLVSEILFINASYLCKIFADDVGESFTKYLMKFRIQKAKELMNDPTIKIYEISGMVGYEDVRYFTRIFKEIEGVTPVQYREKIK